MHTPASTQRSIQNPDIFELIDHFLRLKFDTLQTASSYRNLGLVFHSWPMCVRFNRTIHPSLRGFLRNHFEVSETKELLPMIQLLGTLWSVLRSIFLLLSEPEAAADVAAIRRKLAVAEMLLQEAIESVSFIRQGVEQYCELTQFLRLEGWMAREGDRGWRRMWIKKKWISALPWVCWEGELPW